ncbi:hypothetical protein BDY19DRAFT_333632 [Irpex rosettiformis]|uniref:Uncharacterized protein n=1 Tax=Irpex rosettiformis TaxID=378272 RepID=A0ACB8TY18_9APHY|nr:hypothetical protein BDY19DRAFT_333632 [Irpex rosettiformis]
MASQTPTDGTATVATTQKYVPRFKRDPTAVASAITKLYAQQEIMKKFGGQSNHTFCRSPDPNPPPPLQDSEVTDHAPEETPAADPESPVNAGDQQVVLHPLIDEFCRVMIHKHAHLSPPKELWTRNNIPQLDANIGRAVPVFSEVTTNGFEFLGWYKITRWELCPGGGAAVQNFIRRRKFSQRDKTADYWRKALGQDWARVQLERVSEMTVNPMQIEG